MNPSMQPAIRHLFQTSALDDVSRERLEAFVEEYPCFGFGHYLLSRKLRAENADHFLTATQKTGLYFPNPFWLQWLLENSPDPETDEAASSAIAAEAKPDHSAVTTEPEPVPELSAAGHTPESIPDLHADPAPEYPADAVPEHLPALAPEPFAEQELPRFLPAAPENDFIPTAAELLLDSIEKARQLRESLQKINEELHPAETPIRDEEPPFILAEAQPVEPAPTPTALPPLFEPFHTIDYFASQGIRLTVDENPTDSLGRQLKSFTDWLKVMRRLPQKEREIIPDRVAEQTIQNIAAHSIEGKEVVTETMAEVLAKQGMRERARIVYEKLSLLNPEKSAYFAAKIEQLNIS